MVLEETDDEMFANLWITRVPSSSNPADFPSRGSVSELAFLGAMQQCSPECPITNEPLLMTCWSWRGNSPKRSTMQCREMQIHDEKCFSNESCDAQHGHKERWDFSPISGRKRSAISECAFNMSFAIGRLSEKRANKLLKKRKVKRMFMICCCVT